MAIVSCECPSCRKSVSVDDSTEQCFCMYCGTKITVSEVLSSPERMAAFNELLKRAEEGDVDAQYKVGSAYMSGKAGPHQDYVESMKWFRKAADQGDPYAMYNISILYSCGYGVHMSCTQASYWLNESINHGLRTKRQ